MDTYLLAAVPSPEVIVFVDTYRQKYGRYTTYDIVPHFTVCPPFYNLLASEPELVKNLTALFHGQSIVKITIDLVGFFEAKNNVAFFQPDEISTQYLRDLFNTAFRGLKGKISNKWPDYPTDPKTFVPHLTIAEHIPDKDFVQVKAELENLKIDQSFNLSSITLFKKQDHLWPEIANIPF